MGHDQQDSDPCQDGPDAQRRPDAHHLPVGPPYTARRNPEPPFAETGPPSGSAEPSPWRGFPDAPTSVRDGLIPVEPSRTGPNPVPPASAGQYLGPFGGGHSAGWLPPGGPVPYATPMPPQGSSWGWTMRRKLALLGAAAAVALGAGGVGAAVTVSLTGGSDDGGTPAAVAGVSTKGDATTAQVAKAVQPSVVSIQTVATSGEGTGSGIILRADGTIMTNAHVVSGARQVTVKFSDRRTAPARILGIDRQHDIAVIQAQGASGLRPAVLGNSSRLAVGDPVLAVGSPLGLDGSVTSGIVSALGRSIQEGGDGGDDGQDAPPFMQGRFTQQQSTVIRNAIQTDAAINPGNSGGALVNGAGQVIGVNTAIATSGDGSGSIGVGFAIPVNDARKAVNQIITTGSI
ncbi:S1C family serine protease [Actinomadura rupiterrae]|uniref:S1C family serine protease n=1 Tax=Actinomadura rupiterrae TaxID=559627 RepID=UPI0020A3350D|nr:trypsin-like peptidase domain-containing protein [Actinomadura rupiterrae]MCP2343681.1 putative serine protease PepD [Actinomadura rupiterrae]